MDRRTVSPPLLPALTPGPGLRKGPPRKPCLYTSTAVLISETYPESSGVCDVFGRMTFLDFSGTWVGIQLIIRPRARALQSIANVTGSLERKVPGVKLRLKARVSRAHDSRAHGVPVSWD